MDHAEPIFKYMRIACDLNQIVASDSIACCKATNKMLVIGTAWGEMRVLDHEGNQINYKKFPRHVVSINSISTDSKGEFIATCSDDGKIYINSLYSEDETICLNLESQIKSVILESEKKFIVGSDQLIMFEKTLLRGLKKTILYESEGIINSMRWNGQFLAFASSLGVRVFDINEKCSLGLIKWEKSLDENVSDLRCNLYWSNSNTLLIGWFDTIRICVIRKRNLVEVSTRNLPGFIVDLISTFRTDFYICGLAPLEENQLVVLGVPKHKDEEQKSQRPVLCVIQYKSNEYEELCTDSLTLKGFENFKPSDYSLECLIDEDKYFIVSPKDIVSATLYETDDRVKCLIEHDKYEKAMEVIKTKGGKYTITQVARLYVDYLLSNQKYEEAAKICVEVFDNNKMLWEEEVYKFVKVKQLRSVSSYLPRTQEFRLNPQVYEMVLYEFLKFDKTGFLSLIKEWPPILYNTTAVINACHDHFDKKEKKVMLEALAVLYSYEHDYDKALTMYLKLKHKDVFKLIQNFNLHNAIKPIIVELLNLDVDETISILIDYNKINPDDVIKELEHHEKYLYMFLDAFEKVCSNGKYDWRLIELYAKYDSKKLLPFLKRSKNYPLQDAFNLCKNNLLYLEMVYLLDRMGNHKEALPIITQKLKNVQMAINFCREHNDEELWEYFLDENSDNSEIITLIMDGMPDFYFNPELFINKINSTQCIPGLKDALLRMLNGFHLQVSIHNRSTEITKNDYFLLHEKLIKQQKKGLFVRT